MEQLGRGRPGGARRSGRGLRGAAGAVIRGGGRTSGAKRWSIRLGGPVGGGGVRPACRGFPERRWRCCFVAARLCEGKCMCGRGGAFPRRVSCLGDGTANFPSPGLFFWMSFYSSRLPALKAAGRDEGASFSRPWSGVRPAGMVRIGNFSLLTAAGEGVYKRAACRDTVFNKHNTVGAVAP